MWGNTLVNGAFVGGLYAMIALGLSLVFGVMRLVNLAHGAFVLAGGYLAYFVAGHLGLDPLVCLLLVCPAMFAIGYALQRVLLTNLLVRGTESVLVATFGLLLVGQSLFTLAFTSEPKSLTAPYGSEGLDLFGVQVRVIEVIAMGLAVSLTGLTASGLRWTRVGRAIRAAASDPATAETVGIDVRHIYALTFGIALALAAVAGVVVGVGFSLTPDSGLVYLTIGVTVVVLGGIGSIGGTLVGGILVGMIQAAGGQVFGPVYQYLTVYVIFLILLGLRPQGLFGKAAA